MKIKILLIALLLTAGTAQARIVIPPISGPIVKKIVIVIPELVGLDGASGRSGSAKEFAQVVRGDLNNTGLFDIFEGGGGDLDREGLQPNFDAWFQAGAEALVKGGYQGDRDSFKVEIRLFDVVKEKQLVGKYYAATSGKVREAAHRFANEVMKELTGIEGFFTSKIAFTGTFSGHKELYIMDYDGFGARQLTNDRSNLLSPDCSPDGSKIVFNSDKIGWSQDILLYNLAKGKIGRLAGSKALEQSAEWSPDGSRIAYSAVDDIFIMNADGSGARRITKHWAIDVSPTWSPDGSRIAFVSDRSGSPQIYVMSAGGGEPQRITFAGNYNTDPSWSPNPEVNRIAFIRQEGGGETNIFTINPDGSDEQRLTWGSGRNGTPAWSPDGHYIAFTSTKSGTREIHLMYLNGENQVQLTQDGGNKSFPTWCK